MDPISITLGVAPLCLAAFKGSRRLKEKIKLLRKYEGEINRFRTRFKTQIAVFRDESQLLLQAAGIQRTVAVGMLSDYSHEQWTAENVEQSIQKHLDHKYTEVREVSERIVEQIGKIEDLLGRFETEEPSHGRLQAQAHRAGHALGLVMRKSLMEDGIESLIEAIGEFRRHRKTAKAFQKPDARVHTQRKTLPHTYGLVAKHSASFFSSLSEAWSCLGSAGKHMKHTARWFLQSDTTDSCVNFRVGLESEVPTGTLNQRSLLLLRIRSENTLWANATFLSPGDSDSEHDDSERPAKVRKVRFAESPWQASARAPQQDACDNPNDEKKMPKAAATHNLGGTVDMCNHLFKQSRDLQGQGQESSIGYLKSQNNLSHHLTTDESRESTAIQTHPRPPASLASAVRQERAVDISVNDQLRLALRLSQAVLQYHATQWWPESWDLSHLSYFDTGTELSESLETLHIGTRLTSKTEAVTLQAALADALSPPADDDGLLLCGVRNVTLYCLGATLLQIGRWECLPDPSDIVQIRKTAARPSRMGPKFDRLIASCLYCDFGFGADLNTRELQTAMYENVICELERMVHMLEGNIAGEN
ncbi:hypothetical protein B0T25DRAFT_553411 [Lasiosphaeria hispida]|uniref:DUF7580 domain-containing protein n=1 Tax=Lasiosphaeria hispida TaxID=260671 RepID=A0AAJ0HCH0_9PEZI|nr:hypothetical protein B0T25DRAFT_553411 [Lasiosphaeria hispida]